jgi:hypothetical protein
VKAYGGNEGGSQGTTLDRGITDETGDSKDSGECCVEITLKASASMSDFANGSNVLTGILGGAGTGATAGAVIGSVPGAVAGVVIGGVVGGVIGAMIPNEVHATLSIRLKVCSGESEPTAEVLSTSLGDQGDLYWTDYHGSDR